MCVAGGAGGSAGIGYAALATQAIGGITSAIGASYQSSVQKMGLKLDATLSGINADRDRDVSRMIVANGYQEEMNARLQTGQVKGSERAAMGANNVDMTTGSALNRLVSTDYVGEANAQQIRLNAARSAVGYRTDALNYQMRAGMDKAGASGISPFLTGATSLLGSATNVASNWYGMGRAGVFGSPTTITGPNIYAPMSTTVGGAQPLDQMYRYGTLG